MADTPGTRLMSVNVKLLGPFCFSVSRTHHAVDQACCSAHKHAQCVEPLCWPLPDTQPWHSTPRNAPEGELPAVDKEPNYSSKNCRPSSLTTDLNATIHNNNCLREMACHRIVCSRNDVSAASNVDSRRTETLSTGQTRRIHKPGSSNRGHALHCTVLYCTVHQLL